MFRNGSRHGKLQPAILILLGILLFIAFLVVSPRIKDSTHQAEVRFDTSLIDTVTAEGIRELSKNGAYKATLVNLWATWCAPCIEEFPYLVRLQKEYSGRGLQVLLVSLDMKEDIQNILSFLKEQSVDFKTYLKDQPDQQFIDGMSKDWSGALPATFFFDSQGNLLNHWTGDAEYEDFAKEADKLLSK